MNPKFANYDIKYLFMQNITIDPSITILDSLKARLQECNHSIEGLKIIDFYPISGTELYTIIYSID